jgi:hypothetical protein
MLIDNKTVLAVAWDIPNLITQTLKALLDIAF